MEEDRPLAAIGAKSKRTALYALMLLSLTLLGVVTFLNSQNIRRNEVTLHLLQKGIQLRNSYETLEVTRIQGTSYSQFPHRLLELHADENAMYSYRDDFYKSPGESEGSKQRIVIYMTERQVFDDPEAVARQPECEAMVRIESEKRQPESYESEPAEITLKYQSKQDSDKKLYVYSPKLGHCKSIFSDERLLRMQGNANSIRYTY